MLVPDVPNQTLSADLSVNEPPGRRIGNGNKRDNLPARQRRHYVVVDFFWSASKVERFFFDDEIGHSYLKKDHKKMSREKFSLE
ncbi:hypothetical protein [Bradyrhizobium sp. sGM-13]|uniref:hypothetical protein n=1 Tax=Bradyrhizobium sp. sGM-13 TaxID=2831781 RepID=UPI001BCE5AE8|nr:hypothetical protein [Bradyrhizobium sp. sGM-13]